VVVVDVAPHIVVEDSVAVVGRDNDNDSLVVDRHPVEDTIVVDHTDDYKTFVDRTVYGNFVVVVDRNVVDDIDAADHNDVDHIVAADRDFLPVVVALAVDVLVAHRAAEVVMNAAVVVALVPHSPQFVVSVVLIVVDSIHILVVVK
jgi:hypothetical protein